MNDHGYLVGDVMEVTGGLTLMTCKKQKVEGLTLG